jgi:hypothetical protein
MKTRIVAHAKLAAALFLLTLCGALFGSWGCGDNCGSVDSRCSSIADDSCGKCLASCCCSQLEACATNSSCANLVSCAADCSTNSCIDSCVSDYPSGAGRFNDYMDCADSHCSSSSKCG